MGRRRPDVAMFCHRLDGRAIPRICVTLGNAMTELGADVSMIATSIDEEATPPIADRVSIHVLSIPVDRTAFVVPRLARWIRGHRPDVVFAHGNGPNRAAVISARLSRTATAVVTVEQNHYSSYISPTGGGYSWSGARTLATGVLYARADRVAGVSPEVVEDLEVRFPAVRGRTVVLPNPGPSPKRVERLTSEPADHPWFRKAQRPMLICSVANVIPRKGHDVLIRALPAVRAGVGDARLVVVGRHDNPDYLARLEASARDLGVGDAVAFLGYRANPFPYIAGSDAFALASRNEGAPLVLIEAMACGVPVVATDCPSGPSFVLDRGRTGRLVPMDEPAALADALVRVLTDRELRARLVRRGHDRADRFTPSKIAGAYLDVGDACRRERRRNEGGRLVR